MVDYVSEVAIPSDEEAWRNRGEEVLMTRKEYKLEREGDMIHMRISGPSYTRHEYWTIEEADHLNKDLGDLLQDYWVEEYGLSPRTEDK